MENLTNAEFQILLALASEERHGYGIMQEVKARTGGRVQLGPGTLYSSLKRMLERGWIVETEAKIDPVLNDERRKYYRLTDGGRRAAENEAQRLAEMVKAARQVGLLGGEA